MPIHNTGLHSGEGGLEDLLFFWRSHHDIERDLPPIGHGEHFIGLCMKFLANALHGGICLRSRACNLLSRRLESRPSEDTPDDQPRCDRRHDSDASETHEGGEQQDHVGPARVGGGPSVNSVPCFDELMEHRLFLHLNRTKNSTSGLLTPP